MDMVDVDGIDGADVYTIEFRGDVINTYMTIIYKKNNIIHRDEDLPAIINSYYNNMIRIWYKNGHIQNIIDTDRIMGKSITIRGVEYYH